jgi:hypothetical protein
MLKKISALLITTTLCFAGPDLSLAGQDPHTAAIGKASKQGMLSQRIAKAYFYMRRDVQTAKARVQLDESLVAYVRNHDDLKSEFKDKDLQELFTFIETSLPDYANLINRGYNKKRAKQVLILSETLLEVNQTIVEKLREKSKLTRDNFIRLSGHGQMLSQRIAKLYIAYHAGFQDIKSEELFYKSVIDFTATLKALMNHSQNTPAVSAALTRVESLWKVLRRILDLKQASLPVTVLMTTDKIREEMDAVLEILAQ